MSYLVDVDVASDNVLDREVSSGQDWKQFVTGARVEFVVLDVTPEMASEMIENVVASAKNDKKAQMRYAEAMRSGGWIFNAQPIIFSKEGKLLDGYQRLRACQDADVSFETLAVFNVNEDTLHSMDQQRIRTFANVLEARGHEHQGVVLSSTLTKLIRIENGQLKLLGTPLVWHRLEAVFDSNPEILDAASLANVSDQIGFSRLARTVFCFMALKAGHGAQLRQFLRDMTDMEKASDNPARMLFITLDTMKNVGPTRRTDVDVEIALMILAFNDYLNDVRPSGSYSWTPDYGKGVRLRRNGRPASMAQALKKSPPNCGFPEMEGFPGTDNAKIEGKVDSDWGFFHGTTAEQLVAAAGEKIDAGIYRINLEPELADFWLKTFNKVNRKIQEGHVSKMVSDMKKGLWMVNPQPICFHGNPFDPEARKETRLINGQHRLMACVKSGIPIEIIVATGIRDEAFATFDVHARRSKIAAPGDARVLESVAVLQWRKEMGLPQTTGARPTNMEISQIIANHPEMGEFFRAARAKDKVTGTSLIELSTAGVMTYFLMHIHEEDPDLAPQFTEDLRSGIGLLPDNPVVKGRIRLTSNNRVGERMTRRESLEFLMNLWKKYRAWASKQQQLSLKMEDV